MTPHCYYILYNYNLRIKKCIDITEALIILGYTCCVLGLGLFQRKSVHRNIAISSATPRRAPQLRDYR